MHSHRENGSRHPAEPGQSKAVDGGADQGRAPWVSPELEELPPLSDVVLQSNIEGGGNINDPIF